MSRGNIASSFRSIISNWFHYTNRPCHSRRFATLFFNPVICSTAITKKITKNGFDFQGGRSLHSFSSWWNTRNGFAHYCNSQQGSSTPPPSEPPPNISRIKWMAGILITVILPYFARKWTQFLLLKKEVDTVVETASEVIDTIEVVAEKVEKAAENLTEDLPQGGKVRNAAEFVEDMAERIAKDAHIAGEFLDKVEDIEEKMEEALAKPVRHQMNKDDKDISNRD